MSTYSLIGFSSLPELINHYDSSKTGLKVDLGCGFYKPPGFIGIDNFVGEASQVKNDQNLPDIFMDLNNEVIPLDEGSCSEIRASHFIEHSNLDHVFSQVFRLLKPGAVFHFTVPYANSAEGMYPGHTIFLSEKFFYENIHFQKLFTIEREIYRESKDYTSMPQHIKDFFPFEIARKMLFNACNEMSLICRPKK